MAQLRSFIVLLLVVAFDDLVSYGEAAYNIADYGAKSDGRTDSTKSLLAAWEAACGSAGSATMYVPAGDFLVGQATFAGPCSSSKITVQIDGTLVSPSDLGGLATGSCSTTSRACRCTADRRRPRILLWACKAAGRSCAAGASSLTFRNSKDITISGLTSTDSELYHIVIDGCDGVTVQNVKITAPGNSPNTDGIHVQGSSHVTITGASIKTGDDCISVGPGTTNLWIEQVACGPGHGISIGSLGKEYDEEGWRT
ncbi:unnamed protein product [Musa acuminata var. zebrina]